MAIIQLLVIVIKYNYYSVIDTMLIIIIIKLVIIVLYLSFDHCLSIMGIGFSIEVEKLAVLRLVVQ